MQALLGAANCCASLTFVGRMENQFPQGRAEEEEEDGDVTIHVAGAAGSERSISS